MRGLIIQYLNEIIGLTVMILMGLALISGEAGAVASELAVTSEASVVATEVEFSFRHQGELE